MAFYCTNFVGTCDEAPLCLAFQALDNASVKDGTDWPWEGEDNWDGMITKKEGWLERLAKALGCRVCLGFSHFSPRHTPLRDGQRELQEQKNVCFWLLRSHGGSPKSGTCAVGCPWLKNTHMPMAMSARRDIGHSLPVIFMSFRNLNVWPHPCLWTKIKEIEIVVLNANSRKVTLQAPHNPLPSVGCLCQEEKVSLAAKIELRIRLVVFPLSAFCCFTWLWGSCP